MGDFDDVMAMEPGDEWDLPLDPELAELAPLPPVAAALRLPGALVELRGEAPAGLLERLAPLADTRLHSDEPEVVPVVISSEGARWALDGPFGHVLVEGSRAEDLERALMELLDRVILDADRARLHLDVTCVEIDGTGIVVVSERAEDRARVTEQLLRRGAGVVTDRMLTVLPGSHTVFGYPAPAPGGRPTPIRAVPFTTVDIVAYVHRSPAASQPIVTPLTTAESCRRLLGTVLDRERFGPAVLDVIASTATNASHVEVVHDDPVRAADIIRSTELPPRRAFCVVHRFDQDTGSRPTVDHGTSSLRVARFDDGAVALDAVTDSLLELTENEIDALEELLVEGARAGSGDRRDDQRFERLVAHGMFVPDAHGRRPVPGPEAFGLPNCPSGITARWMWSDRGRDTDERVSSRAPVDSDGSAALAVLRGVLPGNEELRRSAIEVHRRLQDEVVGVERQLLDTIGRLAAVGIEPLVLGSVVNAHDGPLPPYFAESEQVDLLVHDGELPRAVAALEAAGHQRIGLAVAGDGDTHGVVDLRPPEAAEVRVRVRDTLAVGPFGALVDHEEFHRRSVPIRIHGRWCRSLHPEHRFVHACVQVEFDGADPSNQLVRDVVLAAPRADALMAEAMEASERWGATATVTAAVRRVDMILPGLPPWIVERSSRDEPATGRERRGKLSRRTRRR